MNKPKLNIFLLVNMIYLVVTGGINLFGYFRLPETIATQFGFSGGSVNTMPKTVYLLASFAGVFILSIVAIRSVNEQRIKWFLINTLITIANAVMVIIQL